MGVQGLLPLLKSIQRSSHIRDFAGKTIGVDAYGWLHRGAVPCAIDLATGKPNTKYVDFAMHRVRMLYHFGVVPYIVFDGDWLPSKVVTEDARAQRREDSKKSGLELLRMNKIPEAQAELSKAIDITPEMARELIEELKRYQVKYVVAPYEADAQLVYLEKKGIIHGILSEDSDMLIFGANILLTKLDKFGECTEIRAQDYTSCREVNLIGWSTLELRRMAILSGCDYLDGIPKIGLKTAHRFVRKCRTIERTVQCLQLEGKLRVPPGYLAQFDQAEKTFLYQWVYCPEARELVTLNALEKTLDLEKLPFIGKSVEPEVARKVAEGLLNPMTKQPIHVKHSTKPAVAPLLPKFGKENRVDNVQKINSFFKPARVPLAELNPNSLTPSPSQWNVMLRNQSRNWMPDAASPPSSATRTIAGVMTGKKATTFGRGVFTAPIRRPNKKQRLCPENDAFTADSKLEGVEIKSRYFSSAELSPSVLKKTRSNETVDIELWSDESLELAMTELADYEPPSQRHIDHLKVSVPRLSFFRDGDVLKPPATTDEPSLPQVCQDNVSSIVTVKSVNKGCSVLKQYTFAGTDKPRARTDPIAEQTSSIHGPLTIFPNSDPEDLGLMTTTTTKHNARETRTTVKTEKPTNAPFRGAIKTTTPFIPPRRITPSAEAEKNLFIHLTQKTSGSEDLIIPDSESDSDRASISPAASRHGVIDLGAGNNDIEEPGSTPLNLRRFVFGMSSV